MEKKLSNLAALFKRHEEEASPFRLRVARERPMDLTSDRAKEILAAELAVNQKDQGNPNQAIVPPSPQHPRKPSYTEIFEQFVRALPTEELLELGDILVRDGDNYGRGNYYSKSLGQEEWIYKSDLPFVYAEFKKRFDALSEVK